MTYWAVARTLGGRETFAAARLSAAGFETFAPNARTDRGPTPLFPGYLFVRIEQRWRAIERTLGVVNVIRFGDTPARCGDSEIAKIQAALDGNGLVVLPPRPDPVRRLGGARVRIVSGPFSGFHAIYAGMTADERERVLINLLGRPTELRLRREQIADAGDLADNRKRQ